MEILGIIPARGGSKSIKRKNLKKMSGKPLIAWSIISALKSNLNRVIISTEDKKIAKTAKKYGADIPFIRPENLAQDTTPIEPVLQHALEWLEKNENYKPDAVALLQSTNPLRQSFHINEAIKIFKKTKADSVVGVHEAIANNNPYWILKKNKSGKVILATGEALTKIKNRRQELPKHYIRNDIIYLFKPKNLFEKKPNLYGKKVELYITSQDFDIDINTISDWKMCEYKIKKYK